MADKLAAYKVLVFDFDGVIIESNDVKTAAFEKVFSRFPQHLAAMMRYHEINVSKSRYDKFDHLLLLLGKQGDETLISELNEQFSQLVVDSMHHIPLVKGAEALLLHASKRLPLYLASITPQEELEQILHNRNLFHWFKGVYGCPPWKKSDAIREVIRLEHVNSGDVLLIGDSAGDQQAAATAGVHFLARNSGLSFNEPYPVSFADLAEIQNHFSQS